MHANEWLILDTIISVKSQYLEQFNCMQLNELLLVEK